MVITKQLEKEAIEFMNRYWDTYFAGDVETWGTFITDEYKNIGGTEEEIWNSKKEILDYTNAIIDQMVGTAELRNKKSEVFSLAPYILVHEFADIYIKINEDWSFYGKFRLSSILKHGEDGFQVVHQHGSYPDSKTEQGEAFAFDKISSENRELKDAVKRRTVELENKTRELEVEAALERVRTISMGMNKPDDMLLVCRVISEQLTLLKIKDVRNVQTAIIFDSQGTYFNYEYYRLHDKSLVTEIDFNLHPAQAELVKQMKSSPDQLFTKSFSGDDLKDWYLYQKTTNQFIDTYLETASSINWYFYSVGGVALGVSTYSPLIDEEIVLFKRFRNVFELAYRRYLDISKAEAQAREAQIEAALEKVRSRSLAMHKSNELNDVVSVLFEKLKELHIPFTAVGIAISIDGSKDLNAFVCGENEAGLVITNYRLPYFDNRICEDFNKVLENKSTYFVGNYSKEEKDAFYTYILERAPEFSQLPENIKRMIFDSEAYTVSMIAVNKATFNINDFEGKVLGDHEVDIIQRFARVFDQSYTRFLDLQKAEAQAREAQIEAAVEKVRAQSMAMYTTSDLYKVNEEILKQLHKLNVDGLTGVSIYLVDEHDIVKVWDLSSPGNISKPNSYSIKYDSKKFPVLGVWVELWKTSKQDYFVLDFPEESLLLAVEEFKEVLPEMAVLVKQAIDSGQLKHQWAAAGRLSDGLLAIDLVVPPTDDTESIVTKMAGAFNLAYQRFQDLQKAEAQAELVRQNWLQIKEEKLKAEAALSELKATQTQLIHAEKMASLGELTAGIAHEIQNPLNFVNNFSEVSSELVDEMNEELEKGDLKEAKAIASDIRQNLEKIGHHGKRADAIVKGMLQHSRSSAGEKQLTDINKLADEFLRLAYHGVRAKDKTFNVTLKTDYDQSIGSINIVSQDIGRVILNLINNAFYAVHEKKKQIGVGYEPEVSISTRRANASDNSPISQLANLLMISIGDNGNGIPQKIMDKIFQPFFTTKPTGEGTGLGLSLCYDIVKSNGGEIKVNTTAGEGAQFVISLPQI